jgi:cytochrome c biogenesis protein CcdA
MKQLMPHLKKLRTLVFVLAIVTGMVLLTASIFWLAEPEHRDVIIAVVAGFATVVLVFNSYAEYRRAQREEDLRRIKEAIRETMWEMRQKP